MPLIINPDLTSSEISQFRLFQIAVFEKLFAQLHRYVDIEPNKEKAVYIMQLMKEYGRILNASEDEFMSDVEKHLQMKHIFDLMYEMF